MASSLHLVKFHLHFAQVRPVAHRRPADWLPLVRRRDAEPGIAR